MVERRSIQSAHQQSFIETRNTHSHTKQINMAFNNTLTSNQRVKDLLVKLQKFDAFRFKYESAQQYIEDRMNMDLARLKKNPKNLLD